MGNAREIAMSDSLTLTDKVTARGVRNLAMTPEAEEFLGNLSENGAE